MSKNITNTETTHAAAESLRQTFLFNLAIGEPVALSGSTAWEELRCVGYDPLRERLEAVVEIKRVNGYGTPLCLDGTPEYVRFFVDWGSGFQHVGLASFRAHDIPNTPANAHPLRYAVEAPLDVGNHRTQCGKPTVPRVRAVLSWNIPPSLDPNAVPVFGNRTDAHIQIVPLPRFVPLPHPVLPPIALPAPLAVPALHLPDLHLPDLHLAQPEPVAHPPLAELAKSYAQETVPAHRVLFPALAPLLSGAAPGVQSLSAEIAQLKELKIDLSAAAKAILQPKSDSSFEELTCVGFETDTDTLAAVIRIKRPAGYSGDLCHAGSLEYLAFWADWDDNGSFDQYLGTAQMRVHDLGGALPADGVSYAVTLFSPAFSRRLKACTTPVVVRIRAVLSWSHPPSTIDPNAPVVWGNRLDVTVQLRPARGQGLYEAIYRVGGVALPDISALTFLAYPSATLGTACTQPPMDRPFGDDVTIQGRLYNTGPAGSVRYRIRYKPHAAADIDANWTPVTLHQTYRLIRPPAPSYTVSQTAVTEPGCGPGWFDYLEDLTVSPPINEIDSRLADWQSQPLEGRYDLRLEYRRITDPPGFYLRSSIVTVVIHNHQFVTNLVPGTALDAALDVDIVILGGDCHAYKQGDTIKGELRAVDPYFWRWTLSIEPASHVHGSAVTPPCRVYHSITDSGDASAPYAIDTSKLDKCGYALILRAEDRTIRNNNGAVVHEASKAVGFSVT